MSNFEKAVDNKDLHVNKNNKNTKGNFKTVGTAYGSTPWHDSEPSSASD